MKKTPQALFIFLTLFLLGCNACQTTAQTTSDPKEQVAPEPSPPLLGGFNPLPLDSALAEESFSFLKASLARLEPSYIIKSIKEAEYQVVAGFNIRFSLELASTDGKIRGLKALIYKDLSGNYHLLQYEIE